MSNSAIPVPQREDALRAWMRPLSFVSALMLAWLLSACGGGGGGSGMTETNVPQPPPGSPGQIVQSAPAPQEPFDVPATTLGASSGGKSYAAIYSQTPNNGTTLFDGQQANSSTISLTITENGTPIVAEIDTVYYLENPYRPLGMTISANGGQFDFLYNSIDPLPSTLAPGDSGPLGSGSYYAVKTNDSIGSLTETYSVAAWNSSSALLLKTSATGSLNGQVIDETITYVMPISGALILSSVDITVNGAQLTLVSACEGCWDY